MALFKAVLLGGILTWIVALILGSNHQRAGWLSVHEITIQTHHFYWSWPLFFAATLLAWAILVMLD